MQIKADYSEEELINNCQDPLAETACHPIGKLRAVAALLTAYPNGPFEMTRDVLQNTAEIIEDATNEIEYLINLSSK